MRRKAHPATLGEQDAETRAGRHSGTQGTMPPTPDGDGRQSARAMLASKLDAGRRPGLTKIQTRMGLLDPGALRAIADAAGEAFVLEPAVIGDGGSIGPLLLAHQKLLGHRRL